MPVLVSNKYDEDPFQNGRATLETPFSHYMSMGNVLGRPIPKGVSGLIWLNFKFVPDFMPVLIMYKFDEDRIKTKALAWRHCFPCYKSMGAICCHGNQSFDGICPKYLCSLSPTPVMLHIKFDKDCPTGLRDIQV